MNKLILIVIIVFLLLGLAEISDKNFLNDAVKKVTENVEQEISEGGILAQYNPLSIESLRNGEYTGSDIVIEQTLAPGTNYNRYIASYKSEGLKIYALLTVPQEDPSAGSGQVNPDSNPASTRGGERTRGGWPVIIFNHGYIPPLEYQTTERYLAYTDAFSSNGYIVFRPDYRGHGNSEGRAEGGYGSNAYTIDVLNAISSIKKYENSDPERIGMWGHSMGGHITLRSMVVNKDIKAGVIWGGVVASYPDLINNWRRGTATPSPLPSGARRWRQLLMEKFGSPEQNPTFWNSISATSFLKDISGPLQLHHGTADDSVPVEFSEKLYDLMISEGKTAELYLYPGDDHDISTNLSLALSRSVEFFDKYVK